MSEVLSVGGINCLGINCRGLSVGVLSVGGLSVMEPITDIRSRLSALRWKQKGGSDRTCEMGSSS